MCGFVAEGVFFSVVWSGHLVDSDPNQLIQLLLALLNLESQG